MITEGELAPLKNGPDFPHSPVPVPQLICVQLPLLCKLRPGEFHGQRAEQEYLGTVIHLPWTHLGCACFA